MKILVISPDYPDQYRSIYTFVKGLVDQFTRMGHLCCVIAPYSITKNKGFSSFRESYYNDGGGMMQILRPNFISLSNVKIMGFRPSLYFRRLALKRALKNLPFKPDVIYAHFWRSGREIYSFAKEQQIPLFVACGESLIPENDISPKYKDFYNYVRGVICVSTKNMEESIGNGMTIKEKCLIAPNAVNPLLFCQKDRIKCREELGYDKDAFIVAFCGTLCHRKGVKKLSDAIRQIKGRTVSSFFIGRNDNEIPNCEHVLFCGEIAHDRVATYLSASDVFVLPTLHEGCCNAIVEAMACGLPIVSSNLSFNKDILNEDNSILINPESEDEIATAIVRLRDDLPLRKKLSVGASKMAQTLTIEKRAEKIVDFMYVNM